MTTILHPPSAQRLCLCPGKAAASEVGCFLREIERCENEPGIWRVLARQGFGRVLTEAFSPSSYGHRSHLRHDCRSGDRRRALQLQRR